MAVNKVPQSSRLVIKVQTGLNGSGNPVFRQRTFNNVKSQASDADIHAIATGLSSLQKHTVIQFSRIDEGDLVSL